ncbi:MAG: hypothetical protein K0Q87_182 [Neobacillus sp.]|nr:hypothetical protein [Neobacillus sp.]
MLFNNYSDIKIGKFGYCLFLKESVAQSNRRCTFLRVQAVFKDDMREQIEIKIAENETKEEFADRNDISLSYFYRALNQYPISPAMARKISDGLNMKMTDLFDIQVKK